MCCGISGNANFKYVWTDGVNTVEYESEDAAKMKVLRRGGTYSAKRL